FGSKQEEKKKEQKSKESKEIGMAKSKSKSKPKKKRKAAKSTTQKSGFKRKTSKRLFPRETVFHAAIVEEFRLEKMRGRFGEHVLVDGRAEGNIKFSSGARIENKNIGYMAGESDIRLKAKSGKYREMALELKVGSGQLSDKQRKRLMDLERIANHLPLKYTCEEELEDGVNDVMGIFDSYLREEWDKLEKYRVVSAKEEHARAIAVIKQERKRSEDVDTETETESKKKKRKKRKKRKRTPVVD
ncbi:unnamed protein product, partial [marine sediment metagenome]